MTLSLMNRHNKTESAVSNVLHCISKRSLLGTILLIFNHKAYLCQSFWFDFCFTALQHILDHFRRGQLS